MTQNDISPRALLRIATLIALSLGGCSDPGVLGELTDAAPDVPVRTGPYDECGNGMDDDSDGIIDERCPCGVGESQACYTGSYPNRLVGACADGVQQCGAQVEFGFWAECTGTTLPSEELCDGSVDDDCDGAVDEGCPCSAGDTSPCGSEFLVAPCMAGVQECSAEGVWSSCEGALGPSAESCGDTGQGDGIDNDCDGLEDEGCNCVPSPEVCADGLDNDCDGTIDEPSGCSPRLDSGVPDAGVPDTSIPDGGADTSLPPAEGCDGVDVPDIRDRIVWHTAIPRAHDRNVNLGGNPRVHIGETSDAYVAVGMNSGTSDGTGSDNDYSFGPTDFTEDRIGFLSFADGRPGLSRTWNGPGRAFGVGGDHLAQGGAFFGDLDVGLGAWTSNPTLYSTPGGPSPQNDLYVIASASTDNTGLRGDHYAISGVSADPDPASYLPSFHLRGVAMDEHGNVFASGSTNATLVIAGGTTINPSLPQGGTGFVLSLDNSGSLRWAQAILRLDDEVLEFMSVREPVVDTSGRYVVTVVHHSYGTEGRIEVQLRDAATGDIIWRHVSPSPSSLDVVASSVNGLGHVVVMGRTRSTSSGFTLGALHVDPDRTYVASFDLGGNLMWFHDLFGDNFSTYYAVRLDASSNGSEVALLIGTTGRADDPGRSVRFGSCERNVPWRRYPHDAAEGGAVLGRVLDDTLGVNSEGVYEMVVAVLDGVTGEHRWSRIADAPARSASISIARGGDVILGLHNDNGRSATLTLQDYGDGPEQNATHVFRLRGR